MKKKNVAIIGATGLIGNQLLNLLLKDIYFADIYVITRRDLVFDDEKVTSITNINTLIQRDAIMLLFKKSN